MERKKTSGCLSRIIRAVTSVQANEAEREADSAKIKDTVRPFLGFHEEAGGNDTRNVKGNPITDVPDSLGPLYYVLVVQPRNECACACEIIGR